MLLISVLAVGIGVVVAASAGASGQGDEELLAVARVEFGSPPKFDIVAVRPDGTSARVLVGRRELRRSGIARPGSLTWSRGARRLLFSATGPSRPEASDVFAVRADGSGLTRLTRLGDAHAPLPAPDGRVIALERISQGTPVSRTSSLWLMNVDGSGLRRLLPAKRGFFDTPGSWTRDGRALAFTRCRFVFPPDGRIPNLCAIYRVRRDGTGLRRLARRSTSPAYSPDGRRIAFVSDRDEHGVTQLGSDEDKLSNELYVMEADGSGARRLTRTDEDEDLPSWSPDGRRIAYEVEGPSDFVRQVMVVDADGSCQRRVIGDSSIDSQLEPAFSHEGPAWRPRPRTRPEPPARC
ncbi:MAG: hypothetical protein ABR521_04595 [Gaiellaceae bacterium]